MEATFQPAAPVGSSVNAAYQGIDAGTSLMERASRMQSERQMQQMREQQMQEAQILMPVIRAKAQADQISAVASIANNARMENLRGQAAAVSKLANDEFLDVLQLADFNSKATALAGLQAKYQWMSIVPEFKGFVDTINEERIKAHGSAVADANMERQLSQEDTRFERAIQVAEIGAGARRDVAAVGAESRENVAGTQAQSRETVAKVAGDTRRDIAGDERGARVTLQKVRGLQQSALQADRDAAKATAAGDGANAEVYRKHAAEYRQQAEQAMQEPEPQQDFTIPGITEDAPAQEPKLYQPPAAPGETPSFTSAVKKPEDVLSAMQQMVNDGVISADEARATLQKLGFKKKGV